MYIAFAKEAGHWMFDGLLCLLNKPLLVQCPVDQTSTCLYCRAALLIYRYVPRWQNFWLLMHQKIWLMCIYLFDAFGWIRRDDAAFLATAEEFIHVQSYFYLMVPREVTPFGLIYIHNGIDYWSKATGSRNQAGCDMITLRIFPGISCYNIFPHTYSLTFCSPKVNWIAYGKRLIFVRGVGCILRQGTINCRIVISCLYSVVIFAP